MLKQTLSLTVLLVSGATFLSVDAFSEDSRGRLPDGRAFRTDNEGNQLVDYIAELELSVENLKRQVSGLEYEVEQKQAIIDSSGASAQKIREKDIVHSALTGAQPAPVAAKQISCPACNCTAEIADARNQALSEAKVRTEEQLRQARAEASLHAGSNGAELVRVKQELSQARAELGSSGESQKRVASVEQALSSSKDELESLTVKYEAAQSEKKDLLQDLEDLRAQNAKLKAVRIEQAATTQQASPSSYTAPEMRAAFMPQRSGNARDAALDSLRGKIATSLNQIQGLISNREKLYASYMSGSRVVDFKPAVPTSSSGLSVQQIRARTDEAQTVRELSVLTRDVNEIRSKIEFDIGMMNRMKRLSELGQ